MPTFTTIALDRLLEPGNSRSASDSKLDRSNSTPARVNGDDSRLISVPNHRKPSVPLPRSNRRNPSSSSSSTKSEKDKGKASWPHISPALYSTPASTPLPDSPNLISPSPYLINHKRRGPRLQKSFSEASVLNDKTVDEKAPSGCNFTDTEAEMKTSPVDDASQPDSSVEIKPNTFHQEKVENRVVLDVKGETKDIPGTSSVDRESECEDFYDLQDSISVASNADGEDFGTDQSANTIIPGGVFYDACDELSSDSGRQMQSSMHDLDTELREMRLSFLMEVEKRKQAEDSINSMRSQWQRLREELRELGLVLPTELSTMTQDSSISADFTEDIRQQIFVTRFVSESIGKGVARAECEEEMQAQLELKNFEIARLTDRLHYYETMNREMSQRNQEVIELARRDRQRRNKVRKWVWCSIATTVTLGSAALAWSYMPNGKTSSSDKLHAPKPDTSTE